MLVDTPRLTQHETDTIVRWVDIIYSCVAFGAGTLLTLPVDSLTSLLVLRFLTGLGLGSALPNAIGLASEYAPRPRRAMIVMFVGSGISPGAIAAGMAAAQLISPFGWRAVFVVGGVLPLLLAVALWRALPESLCFAAVVPHGQEAKRLLRKLRPEIGAHDGVWWCRTTSKAESDGGRSLQGRARRSASIRSQPSPACRSGRPRRSSCSPAPV